jgi:DtxR family transcriptional regulator, Mn-dependent transcriptional regulator
MLPSSTVENYLKAIYLGAASIAPRSIDSARDALSVGRRAQRLMPMGQLAAALGVAPGTATTMVKTLAESGLVRYEPYAGVALTASGKKLAALVLRRHRLIELFLVRVMGYSWDEVHDEAEQLEHVVTDRLIERIDEMLGRPEVDPHGDPIPTADGLMKQGPSESLLTCPLQTLVTVTRVIDQDASFLRFIENHHLKPGQSIEVEHRDSASDSVRVRGKDNARITIGTRAASKLLVQLAGAVALVVAAASAAFAQAPPAAPGAEPFQIKDNSMFVEESFNQDVGVVQNILTFQAGEGGDWTSVFTQEWPLFSHTHQISYTLQFADAGFGGGIADTLVNYRLQVVDEGPGRPAFSPRVSLIVPTGNADADRGAGRAGVQVNLPFSKQVRDTYFHWNAGMTHQAGETIPHLAGSVIYRVRPMFNAMLETTADFPRDDDPASQGRHAVGTISPGFRLGWNNGPKQTVIAVGAPIEVSSDGTSFSLIGYFSYELPFK